LVREMPAVVDAAKNGDWFEIRTTAAEPVLRELLLRDAAVRGIEVTSAGLEEAFLALTAKTTASHNLNQGDKSWLLLPR